MTNLRRISLAILFLTCSYFGYAQVGINSDGATPHPSAMLEVNSNNKGALLPRMTTAERKAIANPAAGLLVFDSDKATLYLFDGVHWLPLAITNSENLTPISRTASDGSVGDQFGWSVSIFGDYAIVGAHEDRIGTNDAQGSAYIFHRSNNAWTQQAKLIASDGHADDTFGQSVAISNDYAVVGAPYTEIGPAGNISQGSAYVFKRSGNTWTQMAKLIDADGSSGDYLGTRLAISGDYIIVGAPGDDVGSIFDQGSACFFQRNGNNWIQQAKVTGLDPGFGDKFGTSVSISGDKAIIGARYDDIGGNNSQGSAYIFQRTGNLWIQQAKLTASDGGAFDNFGRDVSISGSMVIIGARDNNGALTNQGAVYTFSYNGTNWVQLPVLTAFDGASNDEFGASVSISGDYMIVGASNAIIGTNISQGTCYLYKKTGNNWSLIRKIVLPDGKASDQTGWTVSTNGFWVLFGGNGSERVSFLNFEE